MPSYLTIVYKVNDKKAFRGEMDRISEHFKNPGDESWGITAMSADHELRRLSLIEDACNDNKHGLVEKILDSTLIGGTESLNEFMENCKDE